MLEGSTKVLIRTFKPLIHKHVLTWRKNTYSTYNLEKEAKNGNPSSTRANRQVIGRQHWKSPCPLFRPPVRPVLFVFTVEKKKILKNGSEKVPWKTEKRRRKGRMRWDVVEEELRHCPGYRESGICDHAKERVVFSFLFFFFFWRFAVLGFFGSQQGPWLQFWLPLVVPKCGRFPLSLTPMNSQQLRGD